MKPELRWSRISNARVGRTFLSDKCLQDSCSGHFCHGLGLKQEQQQDQDQKRRTGMSEPTRVRITPMSQIEFIVEQLKLAFDGEAWHGPALMEILADVDAQTAAAHPVSTGHSIWELVLHVTAWERVIITRIVEGKVASLSDDKNFGHIEQVSEAAWQQAVTALQRTHQELIRIVAGLIESQLDSPVPGKPYDILFMLHGAVQHAAYHGGQIALLKRARA